MPSYEYSIGDDFRWFALFVRTKHELSVQRQLADKGYETYVPCRQENRKWIDRIKVAEAPLFPNYVFCRFDARLRLPVLTTPDVYSILGVGKKPTPIPNEELESIQRVVKLGQAVEATDRLIGPGEHVLVTGGVLKGLEGTVIRAKNGWQLVVSLTLLQRGVATEVEREHIEILTPSKRQSHEPRMTSKPAAHL